MSAALEATQSVNDGEGQTNDMDLQRWLEQENLGKIYDILQANELDSLELFLLMTLDDVREVASTCKLGLADKLKLVKAVKKLQSHANSQNNNAQGNKAIIMDKEEREALSIIQKQLDHCHSVIHDINQVNDALDAESIRCKTEIESAFTKIHQIVDSRRDELLTRLQAVVKEKKQCIQSELEDITSKSLMMEQQQTTCTQLIQKPLEITNIKALEKRKDKILKITQDVKGVQLLSKTTQTAEICLNCDVDELARMVGKFGDVHGGKKVFVDIVSVKQGNGVRLVDVKWEIGIVDQDDKQELLKEIERRQYKTKMEWKEDDAKEWNEDGNVNKSNDVYTVQVEKEGTYLFVVKVMNGLQCIVSSKVMKYTVVKPMDTWDSNHKSKDIQVTNGNRTVENSNSGWRGVLGTKQCRSGTGIHHWKLKLSVSKDISNSWKVVVGVCPQQHWNNVNAQSNNEYKYCYCFGGSEAKLYNTGNLQQNFTHNGTYGVKFENTNDTLDVYLDTDKKTLAFGVNGVKYGDAYRGIEDTTYRLGVTFYDGRTLELL
eukprot:521004_1